MIVNTIQHRPEGRGFRSTSQRGNEMAIELELNRPSSAIMKKVNDLLRTAAYVKYFTKLKEDKVAELIADPNAFANGVKKLSSSFGLVRLQDGRTKHLEESELAKELFAQLAAEFKDRTATLEAELVASGDLKIGKGSQILYVEPADYLVSSPETVASIKSILMVEA